MVKRRRFDFAPIAITVLIIVVFFFIVTNPGVINMSSGAGSTLMTLFPGIFISLICLYTIAETGGYYTVPAVMGLGMALCYLLGEADTLGLVVDAMLGGLTVSQVQIWIMAMSALFGGVLYSYHK